MTHAQVNTLKRSASKKPAGGKSAGGKAKGDKNIGGKKAGVRSSVKSRALPTKSSDMQLGGLNRELLRSFTEFMREEGLASFVFKSEGFEVELKFANANYVPSLPMQTAAPTPASQSHSHGSRSIETPASFSQSEEKRPSANTRVIKSPFVGTFYRCPAPGKPAFVEIGATVNNGDALCVLEAMKLMNEIEAEFRCKILKVLVEDASPVEYGEALFEVEAL